MPFRNKESIKPADFGKIDVQMFENGEPTGRASFETGSTVTLRFTASYFDAWLNTVLTVYTDEEKKESAVLY
ncbi:MAG: hypothetical protein IJS94_07215, partial [Clostridia bacterium]|nr:hypothetical protein [Clostridia bacterium]